MVQVPGRGKISGVQARLKENNPSILYTHCYNHVLNLCLGDTVKQVEINLTFWKHCMFLSVVQQYMYTSLIVKRKLWKVGINLLN